MIDLAIVLAFIVYSVASGLRAKRLASQSLNEYFLAGRTLKGWRAGTSMAATQYAADTPLLVTGLIAAGGIFALWRLWIYGIAFLIMGYLLGRLWRHAGVLTDAELTEIRYSGRGVLVLRALKALYYGTLINCVVMAFVLVAATRIFEVFLPWHEWLPAELYSVIQRSIAATGIELWSGTPRLDPEVATTNSAISIVLMMTFVAMYSVTGGLRSVVDTDVVQFGFMMVGTLLYAIFAVRAVGDHESLRAAVVAQYGTKADSMLSFVPPLDEALPAFLVVISLQWFFNKESDGTGYLAQRTMACASDRDARVAAVSFSFLQIVLRSLLWLPIVVALLVIFPFDASSTLDQSAIARRELTFVQGMEQLLPVGVRGLMLTGMLAALASTLDTHLNWGASYWSNDLYKAVWAERIRKREATRHELVTVARLSNLLILGIALLVLSHLGSIQEGWQISLLFGAGTGSVLMLRWLWERINLWCEIVAMAISIIVAPLLLTFIADDWLRLASMAAISTAAILATAYLAPATEPAKLQSFYERVRPPGWWSNTARACNRPQTEAMHALKSGILAVTLAAFTMYALLVGIGVCIIDPTRWLTALVCTILAAAVTPFWWRRL
jgi:solute:Na+ symporter, SSS family